MVPWYNMTNVTSANNWLDIFKSVDLITSHLFGSLSLLSLFIIIFVGLKSSSYGDEAFSAAAWLTFIVAMLLKTVGLVSEFVFLLSFIIAALGILFMVLHET